MRGAGGQIRGDSREDSQGKSGDADGSAEPDAGVLDRVTAAVRCHWDDLESAMARGEDGLALGRARARALDALLVDLFARAHGCQPSRLLRPRPAIACWLR